MCIRDSPGALEPDCRYNGSEESRAGEYAGDYQEGAGDKGDEYDGAGRGRTRQEVRDHIPADNG